eukprot:sb/3466157/
MNADTNRIPVNAVLRHTPFDSALRSGRRRQTDQTPLSQLDEKFDVKFDVRPTRIPSERDEKTKKREKFKRISIFRFALHGASLSSGRVSRRIFRRIPRRIPRRIMLDDWRHSHLVRSHQVSMSPIRFSLSIPPLSFSLSLSLKFSTTTGSRWLDTLPFAPTALVVKLAVSLVTQFPLHCGHAKTCLTFAMPSTEGIPVNAVLRHTPFDSALRSGRRRQTDQTPLDEKFDVKFDVRPTRIPSKRDEKTKKREKFKRISIFRFALHGASLSSGRVSRRIFRRIPRRIPRRIMLDDWRHSHLVRSHQVSMSPSWMTTVIQHQTYQLLRLLAIASSEGYHVGCKFGNAVPPTLRAR